MKELYELKERLIDEIKDYAGAGKLSKDDAMTLKALTGAADHLCNLIKDDDGYSGDYHYDGRVYADRSYKRDSMGRYSRTGLKDKLRDLMDEAPDDRTRTEIKHLYERM